MLVIGLTGGIGTGKTEVSKILQNLGASVISADNLAHDAYLRGTPGWQEIVSVFGEQVLGPDGGIDRVKLGAIVFSDDDARIRLNSIVHPKVQKLIESSVRELEKADAGIVVIEVPLLIEARQRDENWISLIHETWVTHSPKDAVLERLSNRDSISNSQIADTIRVQISQFEQIQYADVVIDNSAGLDELESIVKTIWHERLSLYNKREVR